MFPWEMSVDVGVVVLIPGVRPSLSCCDHVLDVLHSEGCWIYWIRVRIILCPRFAFFGGVFGTCFHLFITVCLEEGSGLYFLCVVC